jgi:serine/threonine protein phosphatase PrpC
MQKENIKTSGFTLAKGRDLTGDDFFDVKTIGNITVGIVCDGVGSATAGAEAAQRVVRYIMKNFSIRPKSWSIEKSIKTFIDSINSILYEESLVEYERTELITTLAIVVIEGNKLYGANVGDSRVYLLRDNKLLQLSNDHVMDEEGYENVLTQAIGISKEVYPYYFENIIKKDDIIMLCSDGLYNVLDKKELISFIPQGASKLVKKASLKTKDNLLDDTTAVVIEILEENEQIKLKNQNLIIPTKLSVNDNIDGYVLQKPLIQNERTWLATKKTKQYVIKFAPIQAKDDEILLDLFVKEAWNAKRLKADFFPKAVIPKNRTHRYYVMQYIQGELLQNYTTKNKHLSIDDGVKLAKILLKMSNYLLKYDLVHGDIKPDNIMICKDEENNTTTFKIIDFGSITEIFSTTSKAGTPSFLSTERFKGESISESSEIFSIGVTLYLALTGRYPYGEIEPFQNPSFKEAKKPSTYNSNIPPWLDSVILRAIAIDKNKRYQHYSEFDFELRYPQKVKPYFDNNASIIEKNPYMFYRVAFTISVILNLILIILLIK